MEKSADKHIFKIIEGSDQDRAAADLLRWKVGDIDILKTVDWIYNESVSEFLFKARRGLLTRSEIISQLVDICYVNNKANSAWLRLKEKNMSQKLADEYVDLILFDEAKGYESAKICNYKKLVFAPDMYGPSITCSLIGDRGMGVCNIRLSTHEGYLHLFQKLLSHEEYYPKLKDFIFRSATIINEPNLMRLMITDRVLADRATVALEEALNSYAFATGNMPLIGNEQILYTGLGFNDDRISQIIGSAARQTISRHELAKDLLKREAYRLEPDLNCLNKPRWVFFEPSGIFKFSNYFVCTKANSLVA
ncbi:TPA: hypothetical protein ENX78_17855 [Candidatus Poribacteria bacterium]|nr:hypothetical protein [Candidatus Poribacteria bacterium]